MKEKINNAQTEDTKTAATSSPTQKVNEADSWDDLDITYDPDIAEHLNHTDDLVITDDPEDEPIAETEPDAEEEPIPEDEPETVEEPIPEDKQEFKTTPAEESTPAESEPPAKKKPKKEKKQKEPKQKAEKPAKVKESKPKAEKPAKVKKEKSKAEKPAKENISEAPAAKESTKKEASILAICLPLVIICIAVSLMLAAVNAVTEDRIAQNAAQEKQNAVLALFTDATYASLYATDNGCETYLAIRGSELVGFCVSVTENGFGGAMSLMVGLDTSGSVCGIEIISMAETPGIGTKTKSPSFLDQFRGSTPFVIGETIDAISGATVSSRAVTRAVNTALAQNLDAQKIAAENSLTVSVNASPEPTVPDTPADTTQPEPETEPIPEDTSAETTGEADTTAPDPIPDVDPIDTAEETNSIVIASTDTVFVDETTVPPETEPVPVDTDPVPEETDPPETTAEEETIAEETETEPVPEDTSEETTADTETEPIPEDTSAETTGEAETSADDPDEENAEADTSADENPEV